MEFSLQGIRFFFYFLTFAFLREFSKQARELKHVGANWTCTGMFAAVKKNQGHQEIIIISHFIVEATVSAGGGE